MCYPQPTCYDQADAYLEERITECTNNDAVDVEICIENAKGHHAKWIKECDQRECKESVYAKAEASFNECNTIDDPEEKAKCIAKVEQWIEEMLQECVPEQTCDEKAQDHLVEALDGCYQNTDPNEIEICVANVKEIVAKRLEECECREEVYAELKPKFENCENLDDPEEKTKCLAEVNALLKAMLSERCYPQPTCYDRADAYLEERITECRSNDEVDVETCIETARGHHAKMLKECDQRECEESVYADAEPSFNECNTITTEVEYAECIEKVEQWIADMLQECYPEPTCLEKADAEHEKRLSECENNINYVGDTVEYEACIESSGHIVHDAKRLCEQQECIDGVYAEAEWDYCYTLEDEAERAECLAEVEKWIAEMLQKCYPEMTSHEKADQYLVFNLQGCYDNTD